MRNLGRMLLVAVAGLFVAPALAAADTMVWTVTSEYPYQVQIEFFSQSRDIAWPGGSQAYSLKDSDAHTFSLNCQPGEKICYGAWPTGGDTHGKYTSFWGVGLNGTEGCTNCCGICGRDNPNKTLSGQ